MMQRINARNQILPSSEIESSLLKHTLMLIGQCMIALCLSETVLELGKQYGLCHLTVVLICFGS